MLSANEIRRQFIDYFVERHDHTFVPSSSLVPANDPTLLFTNAGMNQFKDVFLGIGERPYKRAVNSQKCIRAGGKHNDLDDVGKDTYHHTFFEMLGNWSFGDYFKREAIRWAWELLTEVWGLDKNRLHATVFEGSPEEGVPRDDEAFELWKSETDIDPSHIHWGSKKDNFWEMGDTGPCGPCSEIHYDRTPNCSGASLVNAGRPEVIEIWNLVFIQYNRDESGKLTPLPARHVDTGMGLERIVAVLQGKESNYDTDLFTPIIAALEELTGKRYGGRLDDMTDVAFRAIADHVRMATFAITDGVRPGNKGRESVLRSVIRRAVRFGYQYFGLREPFLCRLVPVVVAQMGDAFPELRENPTKTAAILENEESEFYRTVQRGLRHFEAAAEQAKTAGTGTIPGDVAADLQTTYGFPIDLTRQMAEEMGLTVDMESYDRAMERHREVSGQGKSKAAMTVIQGELPATDDSPKYQKLRMRATLLGWVKDGEYVSEGELCRGEEAALVTDKTNFYAEQGGQVGDKGVITCKGAKFEVSDTQKVGETVLHIGRVAKGKFRPQSTVTLTVSDERPHTMRNHTATHLLNWALRRVLGDHVEQRGSLVDAEKTRFDFTHDAPLSLEQVKEVERLVNEKIYQDLEVKPVLLPLAQARQIPGVRAVFGEKYPDPVRVLLIGARSPAKVDKEVSVEFCGGTHVHHTGQIGPFRIVSQEAVAKGVRRVTAVTGRVAVENIQQMETVIEETVEELHCRPEELPRRVESLLEEVKRLQRQLREGAGVDLKGAADRLLEQAKEEHGTKIVIGELPPGPIDQLRNQIDRLRQKAGSAVVVVGWKENGRVGLLAAATDDVVKKGLHAGNLVGQVAKVVSGGGGGKPTMAQAGGKDPDALPRAFEVARQLVVESLANAHQSE